MKQDNPDIEQFRERTGPYRSGKRDGNNGRFIIPRKAGGKFIVLASDGFGWEHVSVSAVIPPARKGKKGRKAIWKVPTWDEMCFIKDLFWKEDETVVQYHPSQEVYVNTQPFVLHLWRPTELEIPLPPTSLIGIPGVKFNPNSERESAKATLAWALANRR